MYLNERKFREGQYIVFTELVERLSRGERKTSINFHPRGGKSDVQRVSTLWAVDAGICSAGFSINMNVLLRNQMGDVDRIAAGRMTRMEEAIERYEISGLRFPLKYCAYKVWPEPPLANGEIFAAFTIQTLMAKAGHDGIIQWTESKIATGKPPLFFFDECQMLGRGQPWGQLYNELYNLGAYVVTMTGTAHRSDGEVIPGFNEQTISIKDVERIVVESDPDPDFIQIVEMEGVHRTLYLRGDIEVGLKYGWNPPPEETQSLCNLSRDTFDFDVNVEENGKCVYSGCISSTPDRYLRKALRTALRRPQIIAQGVDMLVQHLDRLKKTNPDIKAIVFTGNDEGDGDENAHARDVERAIRRVRPQWKCEIATSADEENAADRIGAFDKSQYAVLIVKQSAGVGLDAPTIKVGLDLSMFRQYGVCVQRTMRIATPFGDQFHAIWITPADVMWDRIWFEAVEKNQGEMSRSELEEVSRRRQERKETPPNDVFVDIGDAFAAGIYDSYGNRAENSDLSGEADRMIKRFPDLLTRYTYVEIINRLKEDTSPVSLPISSMPSVEVQHTGMGLDLLKADIASRMRRITAIALEKQGYSKEQTREKVNARHTRFGEAISILTSRLKDAVGIDGSVELGRITNREQLEALDWEAKRIEREIRNYPNKYVA